MNELINIENPINPNSEILDQMISRDLENMYLNLKEKVISIVPPQFKGIANNYISANESKWINKINEKIELIVAMSFPSPTTSLEEGIINSQTLVNEFVNGWLVETLNVPENIVTISTQLLFGNNLTF